jgi:CRP-like cAMP-binding protein
VARVKAETERSLADSILVSGHFRQHNLENESMLSERPIAPDEVHLLLDGLLLIEIDGQPATEVGPGAIFDPTLRTEESKEHVTVRARTPCRLAVVPRDQLDNEKLVGVATEQTSRLSAARKAQERPIATVDPGQMATTKIVRDSTGST